MSSIDRISDASNAAAQQVQQQNAKTAATPKAAAASALQEANETQADTRQEAAKGDQVAIRRLAKQHRGQHSNQPQQAPSTPATVAQSTISPAPGGLNVLA